MAFLDEAGFLLVPSLTRSWAPKGRPPVIQTAGTWTKLSAISALILSKCHRHIRLLCQCHGGNVKAAQVVRFLRYLLKHVPGHILLIWDSIALHKAGVVRGFLTRHPRLQVAFLPAYAPELNPDEYVWTYLKAALANSLAEDTRHLRRLLHGPLNKLKRSQGLLWSRIYLSKLPWSDARMH